MSSINQMTTSSSLKFASFSFVKFIEDNIIRNNKGDLREDQEPSRSPSNEQNETTRTQGNNTEEKGAVDNNYQIINENIFLHEYFARHNSLTNSQKTGIAAFIFVGAAVFGHVLYITTTIGFSPGMVVILILFGGMFLFGVITAIVKIRKIMDYAEKAYQQYTQKILDEENQAAFSEEKETRARIPLETTKLGRPPNG